MAMKKTTSLYSKSVKHATKSFRFCKMVYAGNFLVVGVFLCTRTNLLFAQDLDTKNLTFKPQESSTSKSNNIPPDCPTSTWTYVGIAIGIVIAFGLIGNLILRYLEHKWKRMDYQVGRFFRGSLNPDCISLTEANNQEQLEMESAVNTKYRLPRSKIYNDWQHVLGAGHLGTVYKTTVKTSQMAKVPTAVKVANKSQHEFKFKAVLREIKILCYLGEHPNIVSLIGVCTEELYLGILYVATELCDLGSLHKYLRTSHSRMESDQNIDKLEYHITTEDMHKWCYEIASGMEYISGKNVVLCGLLLQNILLTADKTAKITDFSLARRLYDRAVYKQETSEPLPWRWMAIESLQKLEFSVKSDVWSYGIVLWEIFSYSLVPYHESGLRWSANFVDRLSNGLRPTQPTTCSRETYNTMKHCWDAIPYNRPTFTELKQRWENILVDSNQEVTSSDL